MRSSIHQGVFVARTFWRLRAWRVLVFAFGFVVILVAKEAILGSKAVGSVELACW